jgi:hypothetical protein
MDKNTFVAEEARKITKKYKISTEDAEKRLGTTLNDNKQFLSEVAKASSIKEIGRLATYKSFIKRLKKDIYYSLRQYHQEGGSTIETHISTKERDPYIREFNRQIIEKFINIKNIIDVGGGVYPLNFPFKEFPNLEHYVWVDKDAKAYDVLLKLENPKLTLYHESIGDRF